MLEKKHRIHFVGIGGIGMSGIAEVLVNLGYSVTGSDLHESETTQRLRSLGAQVFIGHAEAHLAGNPSVVVISTAAKFSNPEILEARKRNIPVIPRARDCSGEVEKRPSTDASNFPGRPGWSPGSQPDDGRNHRSPGCPRALL